MPYSKASVFSQPRRLIAAVAHKLGIDNAIRWTLLTQSIRFITGPITMFLMVRYLTPEIQGYAYTFGSVLGLSIFLEMGFSQNILQFASHEFAKLEIDHQHRLSGDADALSRLVSLGRLSFKYYGIASIIFFICLVTGGSWFFQTSENTGVSWGGPWLISCIAAAASLFISPCWALIEGCNQIAKIERFRFYSSLVMFLMTAITMVLGFGLYALVIPSIFGLFISCGYLLIEWRRFFTIFRSPPSSTIISWKNEIWPFQWRIAISWASGYFIFSMITPVVFRMAGPAEAGRFGFTMQLVRMVSSIASSWSTTKLPLYGMLVARRNWKELNKVWKRVTIMTLTIATLGSFGMIIFIEIAAYFYPKLTSRYAGTGVAAILCLSMIIQSYTSSCAYYLRAFKEEPYMKLSVYNAILSAVLIPFLTYYWGMFGASIGYTMAMAIIAIPAYLVFVKKGAEYTSRKTA
jgi:O-antigen/teichoic acid export membrane protein